jgi:hypothetical protein
MLEMEGYSSLLSYSVSIWRPVFLLRCRLQENILIHLAVKIN